MPQFYLDENIGGEAFASILTEAGISFTTYKQLRLEGVADAIWIPRVSAMGLIIVTADKRFRYEAWEKAAIVVSKARVIHLTPGRAPMSELARNFVNTFPAIERLAATKEAPWLVSLTRPSDRKAALHGVAGNLHLKDLS